ncbi:MAG: trypsin-like peptidase domain-containing protein [Nanoarchaeota archaeon]|nr:trypsin-like peptidase domain-containing protein [Nanoarchaeota archaeon]
MTLKKHHKIMIGSFSSLIIIFMLISGTLIFILFTKQELNYNELDSKITDIQSKLNDLTINLLQTREDLNSSLSSLNLQVGSIDEEMTLLKASAGEDFSGIIEDTIKSVVTIRTNVNQGTGFLVSEEGYIVTNAHVLVGAQKVEALTYEQEVKNADFIGYNGNFDIALLKISGDYEKLTLGDSNKVQIGEKVIAIGNPLGLQFSVSAGIISAIHRPGINEIEAYIQTDAALNPGNSGGPLINKEGKVIGINNFKIGGGESLGFALESNYIKSVINDISLSELNQTLV